MCRSCLLQPARIVVVVGAVFLLTCSAFGQNYTAPSTPVIGSPNTVTANAPVPRPATQPCTVDNATPNCPEEASKAKGGVAL